MANSLGLVSNAVAGLGTFSYTVVSDGMYSVECKSTLPYESGTYNNSSVTPSVASALQIEIKQNSTSKVLVGGSASNPTPTQPSLAAATKLQCVAGDVINVILSSANAIDNQPNSVKSNINLFLGE